MGFVPTPVETGELARDQARFSKWLQARERERIFQLACIGISGILMGCVLVMWIWKR